jgi:para-nitrobenzyl esterase
MKKRTLWCFLFMVLFFLIVRPAVSQIQKVKVTAGEIQGNVSDGIASFKGIPFAAPPVGDFRWKAPQPVQSWNGIKQAYAFAPGCMQDTQRSTMMRVPAKVSEDCLYLNVWTAAKDAGDKLPVMVWIYGGAFRSGRTNIPLYEGSNLAKKGVVLVSIAYRVGPFGFLAHPDLSRESGKGSGNYGLQDMIAALQWVKDNIVQFGGDPSRITIFGESAGGIAVSILAASPAAKGLFQRAISESGGFANVVGRNIPTLKLAESNGKNFLEKLGARDIKAARALSADQIQKGLEQAASGGFWAVADGNVLPGDQYELYQAGRFNDTPVLIGTNSDEGARYSRPGITTEAFVKQIRDEYGPHADAILDAYPHATDAAAFKASKDIIRDSWFAWYTWAWARLQSQKGKGKAYVYYFDHRTPASPDGASHGAEISYVFGNLGGRGGAPSAEDTALSNLMSSYWINFARSGDPNGPDLPNWPAFTEKEQKAMFFDADSSARPLPNMGKLKALDSYYEWRREQARKNISSESPPKTRSSIKQ